MKAAGAGEEAVFDSKAGELDSEVGSEADRSDAKAGESEAKARKGRFAFNAE